MPLENIIKVALKVIVYVLINTLHLCQFKLKNDLVSFIIRAIVYFIIASGNSSKILRIIM